MVYRNDVEALEARRATLEAEIAQRSRARDELSRMIVEARLSEEAERRLADLAAGGPARRRRRRIHIAIATVMAVVAGVAVYRVAPSRRDRNDAAIEQLSRFTDQMCSCATSGCVKQVSEAMGKWMNDEREHGELPPNPGAEQMKRVSAIIDRMSRCWSRATTDKDPKDPNQFDPK
jgi:cell division septum initiation protein DivIVA